MTEPAILAEGLGKRYQLGEDGRPRALRVNTLRDALMGGRRPKTGSWIWALDDVSFTVGEGEVLGIIGGNGAGKSTLLKILSRITEPTRGWAEIHGRVGSLLEVGTGFHSELTGRENIFLSGAILGMRRAEIARKLDSIVEFAEVERFLDTPVKRYSSGMYLRLAFAVAAHLEPEILLVDEVLAVGDAAFQRKCLGKMGDVARQGRTVLFVSHNLLAVESLCGRCLWLDHGKVVRDGAPGAVISEYVSQAFIPVAERSWSEDAPAAAGLRLHAVRVRPDGGAPHDPITVHTPVALDIEVWKLDSAASVSVSVALYNEQDVLVFDVCPPVDEVRQPGPAGLLRTVCHIPGDFLNDGLHRVALTWTRDGDAVLREPEALIFVVQDTLAEREGWYGHWPGAVRPRLHWEVNRLIEPLERSSAADASRNRAAAPRSAAAGSDPLPAVSSPGRR
jgi:lipopolysaccharide transport system ATP-binding protein